MYVQSRQYMAVNAWGKETKVTYEGKGNVGRNNRRISVHACS